MKINEVIELFEKKDTWVNWDNTRDRVLIGDVDKTISKIGVCWTITNRVIDQAIKKEINFIITHENPFYLSSTSLPTNLFNAQKIKEKKSNITVYRCHDMWNCCSRYGIADAWANEFEEVILEKERIGFITLMKNKVATVKTIAELLSKKRLKMEKMEFMSSVI